MYIVDFFQENISCALKTLQDLSGWRDFSLGWAEPSILAAGFHLCMGEKTHTAQQVDL